MLQHELQTIGPRAYLKGLCIFMNAAKSFGVCFGQKKKKQNNKL